jgi:hypothetical protein
MVAMLSALARLSVRVIKTTLKSTILALTFYFGVARVFRRAPSSLKIRQFLSSSVPREMLFQYGVATPGVGKTTCLKELCGWIAEANLLDGGYSPAFTQRLDVTLSNGLVSTPTSRRAPLTSRNTSTACAT